MLLDYKDIIIKHYALGMSGREIAEDLSVSKSGVNKFLAAFKELMLLSAVMIPMYRRSGLSVNSPDQNRRPRSLSPGLPKR